MRRPDSSGSRPGGSTGFQPRLETERLVLRPFTQADFPALLDIYTDERTARFIGGACNDEDAWRRLATHVGHVALRGYGVFAVEERASGEVVGYSGPWYPHGWPEPEIAWSLRASHQGRGYATEAARCARGYVYRSLGWSTVVSVIALDNRASIRVAERLGATLERTLVNRGWEAGVWRHPPPDAAPQGDR